MSDTVAVCEHIFDNNRRCGSPAMKGFHFCWNHARYHHAPTVKGKRRIQLSALECAPSMQIALTQIAQGILDDEIPTTKAYALVQVMQLACRALAIPTGSSLSNRAIDIPDSMSHLIEQPQSHHPQPESQSHHETTAPANSDDPAPSSDPLTVPRKKPRMTDQEFEPWRRILFEGQSHPQYEEACRKCDEYEEGFGERKEPNTA